MRPIRGLTEAARAAGMTGGGYIGRHAIRWRMGRIHVGTSSLTVAREFWHKRARKFPRPIKRAVVRVALQEHIENRRLYAYVMGGMFKR